MYNFIEYISNCFDTTGSIEKNAGIEKNNAFKSSEYKD